MLFLNIFILLMYLLLFSHSSSQTLDKIFRAPCKETLKYTNCDDGKKTFIRNMNIKIKAEFKRCPNVKYVYDYILVNKNTSKSIQFKNNPGTILYINKYRVDIGNYTVVLNIRPVGTKNKEISISNCNMTVSPSTAYAVIRGGLVRYASCGENIILDGTQSADLSMEDNTNIANFIYSWTYDCQTCEGVVSSRQKGPIIEISGKKHENREDKYTVKLRIETKLSHEIFHATQIIYVKKKSPAVWIECVLFCTPPFRSLRHIEFLAHCDGNCPSKKEWIWKIYKSSSSDIFSVDSIKNLELKNTSTDNEFIELKYDDLELKNTYTLTAALDGFNDVVAHYKLHSAVRSEFNCWGIGVKVITALSTNSISFQCTEIGDPSYHVYYYASAEIRIGYLIDYDTSLTYMNGIIMPRGGLFIVPFVMQIDGHLRDGRNFTRVKIKSLTKLSLENIKNEYDKKGEGSIKNLLDNYQYEEAFVKLQILSQSISGLKEKDFPKVVDIIRGIFVDLQKIVMRNFIYVQYVSDIMNDLLSLNVSLDSFFLKDVSNFCKNMSVQLFNTSVKFDNYRYRESTRSLISKLMSWSLIGARPNFTAITLKNITSEVTTVNYIIDESGVNTELNYEYLNDEDVVEHVANYKDWVENFINVCKNSAKALLLHLALKYSDYTVNIEGYTIKAFRKRGFRFDSYYKVNDMKLTFPGAIRRSYSIFNVFSCTTSKNLFWWDTSFDLVTDISIIEIMDNMRRTEHFEVPINVQFNLNKSPNEIFPSLPVEFNKERNISSGYDDELLTIQMVALEAKKSLCVEFLDLEKNVHLNVVSAVFEVVTKKHFHLDFQTIDKSKNFFVDSRIYDYDSFRLISAVPTDHRV